MKASTVIVVAALLGCGLGFGMSAGTFGVLNEGPLTYSDDAADRRPDDPQVLVDQRFFDFGQVEREAKIRHTFDFTNLGKGVLTLKSGGTTCTKCTIAEIPQDHVAHGETVGVTVEYTTSYAQPQFRQTATILTNDPQQPRVELNIFGTVVTRYRLVPDSIVLSKMSTNETRTATLTIFSYVTDSVEVVSHSLTGDESAPFFEVTSDPIPKDKITDNDAKSACRVTVTIKPGLPLGPIRQTIRLVLKMEGIEGTTPVDVMLEGRVESDVSLVGANWNADVGILSIGAVKRAEGASRKMLVLVHGAQRHDVQVKFEKADPEWIKVEVGEPSDLTAETVQIPVTVEIPPGAPVSNHLGNKQGKFGEVLLESTHPEAKRIRMYVKFVVEE